MADCIFCKIAAGEIPATVVFEDDDVIAIEDLNPQAPVHVLVMPKEHHDNIVDDVPADTLAAIVNGQTVNHLHLHVLGGKPLGEGLIP